MQGGEIVFAKVDSVKQNLALAWIVEAGNEFDDRGLALTIFTDQGDPFSGAKREIEVTEDATAGSGIGKGDISELKAMRYRVRRQDTAGLGFDPRFHLEEGNEVGEEEGLIGH